MSCTLDDRNSWLDLGEVPITSVFNVRSCVDGWCTDAGSDWRLDETRHLVQAQCSEQEFRVYTLDYFDPR